MVILICGTTSDCKTEAISFAFMYLSYTRSIIGVRNHVDHEARCSGFVGGKVEHLS